MQKAKEITNEIAINIKVQKRLFKILIIGTGALFVAYIYLIGSITFNVVARKSLESNLSSLTTKVNNLDLAYLDKVNKIDKDYALSLGFVETRQSIFASRDSINHFAVR